MRVLLLDNFDSFTYNLFHYAAQFATVDVRRNDEITLDEVAAYDAIILSPGPGLPKDAGIMPALIKQYFSTKPILGVCLGHQAIAEAFGAKLTNLHEVFHGVSRNVIITQTDDLFSGMPTTFEAGRYHSWATEPGTMPNELIVAAEDDQGICMALAHASLPIKGVQFHPESVLTPEGLKIIENFIILATKALYSGQHPEVV